MVGRSSVLGWLFCGLMLSAHVGATVLSATASNDATRIVYEMQYSGAWQFKQVLIDTDRNLNTGFREIQGRLGADYLLEGDLLYRYSGSGSDFTWTQIAAPRLIDNGSLLRWRIDRAQIGESAFPNTSLLLFRLQNGAQTSSDRLIEHVFSAASAISAPAGSNDGELVKLSYRFSGTQQFHRAYIDADLNAGTGFSHQGIGADFMVEGNSLRAYTGTGSNFSFNTIVGQVTYRNQSGRTMWKFDRDSIGASSDIADIKVLFEVESAGVFNYSQSFLLKLDTRNGQRVAIPAYFPPDINGLWKRVEDGAPKIGLVVVNPSSGEATEINFALEAQVDSVRLKGIEAIGYVFTKTGGALRPAALVKADIDRYRSFYTLDGYFIDNVSDTCADVSYYQDLANHMRAADPFARVVFNPGKNLPQCFEPLADVLVVHEGPHALVPGPNYLTWGPDSWIWQFPKQRFWHLIHSAQENSFPSVIGLARSRHAGWLYVTPDADQNLWDSLPSTSAFNGMQLQLTRQSVEVRSDELASGQELRLTLNDEEIALRGGEGAGFQQGLLNGTQFSVSITQQPASQKCLLENASGVISELTQAIVTVRCANSGSSSAPTLTYEPTAGSAAKPGSITLTGGSGVGETASALITITPSGGSGSGSNATAQLGNCTYANGAVGFNPVTGTLTFVGETTTPQTRALSCVRGEAARSAVLTCDETRFGAGTQQRIWRVTCPAAVASDGDYVDEFVYDTAAGGLGQIATQTRKTTTGQLLHQESAQYDGLGRPQSTTTSFDNRTWASNVIYDSLGRVDTVQDSTSESIRNFYTDRGFLHQVRENSAANLPLVTMLEQDERGQSLRERKAAGILVERVFDVSTGLIDRIRSGIASTFPLTDANALVQNLNYDFDKGDNLLVRQDRRSPAQGGGQREVFHYDTSNRLLRGELNLINGNIQATPLMTIALTYDRLGNICSKADLSHPVAQAYTYAGHSGCAGALNIGSRSPHQVTQAFGLSMDHDAAGNRIRETHATDASRNRRMVYDALGQMSQTIQGDLRTSFAYSAGGKRYRRVDLQPGSSSVTRYLGAVEYIERSGQPNETKRYIGSDLVLTRRGTTPAERRYLFSDHLGSVDTITDETGNVVERLSFDAHGNRRAPNWQALTPTTVSATTTRGFTRHEHIDSQNLIHMNGRVYDALTGRFLQPDPVVQNTMNAQNWNPYSYVLNNPLSYTDPSGLFWKKLKKFFKSVLRAAIGVAITVVTQGWGASVFWSGVIGGAISSAISGGDLKAVIVGGITGGLFAQTGFDLDAGLISKSQAVFQHGVIGGASSALSGGKFHEGFLSASFGKLANFSPLGDTGIPSVLAGGLASKLSGGDFSDGATQAAVGFLQNNIATKLVKGLVKGKSVRETFTDIASNTFDVVDSCGNLSIGCAVSAGSFVFDLASPLEISEIKAGASYARRVLGGGATRKNQLLLTDQRPYDLRGPKDGYRVTKKPDGSYHHTRYRGEENIRHSWDSKNGNEWNHHVTDQDLPKGKRSWSWDE